MTPGELSSAIVAAVRGAVADGELAVPEPAVPAPHAVPLRSARSAGPVPGGDYATPLPLRLAPAARRPAGEVAALLAERLGREPGVRGVRVTGAGVLTVDLHAPGALAAAIVAAGEAYARPAGGSPGPAVTRDAAAGGHVPAPPGPAGGAPDPARPAAPVWPWRPLTFDNPGFLVRFAHVRAAAVARYAAGMGIARGPLVPESLAEPRERDLLALLGELPRRAGLAAARRDPYALARHLERVADAYHDVYERCPALPKGDERPAVRHHARLWLAEAVRVALAGGLRTLGETPPPRL